MNLKYLQMKRCISVAFFFLLIVGNAGCDNGDFKDPTIKIETQFGDIYVELYPDKAPKTVKGFLSYVDAGYFKNTNFYRVLKREDQPSNAFKSELIQGGLWDVDYKKQKSIPGIPHESTKETGLLHKAGTISLARAEPGTASTEFFICLTDQPVYDFGGEASPEGLGFSPFGKVVRGMKIVKQINMQPNTSTTFLRPIKIWNIVRVKK